MDNIRHRPAEELAKQARDLFAHIRVAAPRRPLLERLRAFRERRDDLDSAALDFVVGRIIIGMEAYLAADTAPEERAAMLKLRDAYAAALGVRYLK